MSDIINKLQELISQSNITEEELQEFYNRKIADISYNRKNKFSNEFDKVISEQVYKQVNTLFSNNNIDPVIAQIVDEKLESIASNEIAYKIKGLISLNITEELEEKIKDAVNKKIQSMVVIDEANLYNLENNQKEE
jgi:hypothetical protein